MIDLDKEWEVTTNDFKSKSRNSGFIGHKLKSRVTSTIYGKDCFINK